MHPQGTRVFRASIVARAASSKTSSPSRSISAAALTERYFAARRDGLGLPNNAEELIVALAS
jgi:hypothetical protein